MDDALPDEEAVISGKEGLEKGKGLDVAVADDEVAIAGAHACERNMVWTLHCRMGKLPLKVKRNWTWFGCCNIG